MDIEDVGKVTMASSGRPVAERAVPIYVARERTSSTNGRSSLISGRVTSRLKWPAPSPAEVGVEGGCVAMSGCIVSNSFPHDHCKYRSGRTAWNVKLRIDI